jgi:hypothetical protein
MVQRFPNVTGTGPYVSRILLRFSVVRAFKIHSNDVL